MILLLLILGTVLYVKIALLIIRKVPLQKNMLRKTVILLFILLPVFDVLIGYVVYLPLCNYYAGVFVYEKLQTPLTIYIDEKYIDLDISSFGIVDVTKDKYMFNGISYVEIDVNNATGRSIVDKEGLNRFFINQNGELIAKHIDKIESKLLYKYSESKLFLLPITIRKAILSDIRTSHIFSKNISVSIEYLGVGFMPYFNWLRWHDKLMFSKSCNDDIYKFRNLIRATITN